MIRALHGHYTGNTRLNQTGGLNLVKLPVRKAHVFSEFIVDGYGCRHRQNTRMKRAEDSQEKCHFRSERMFCSNGQWFFASREGDMGPYTSKLEAELHLNRFLGEKVELQSFQASRAKHKASNGVTRITSLADRLRQNEALDNRLLDRLELIV